MNKLNPFLEIMNEIDDDIVSGAIANQCKRPRYFKPMLIAAAAAVLCGATAVTAIAGTKPAKEYTINEEPVEVECTVYTDDRGREIRTYAYKLPDYAFGKEVEGRTAVGQVRVVARDDNRWGGWEIVDEEGNVFHYGINNKEVEREIAGKVGGIGGIGFGCTNVRDGFNMAWFNSDNDKDLRYERKDLYIIRSGDEETHKRLCEAYGVSYSPLGGSSEDSVNEE